MTDRRGRPAGRLCKGAQTLRRRSQDGVLTGGLQFPGWKKATPPSNIGLGRVAVSGSPWRAQAPRKAFRYWRQRTRPHRSRQHRRQCRRPGRSRHRFAADGHNWPAMPLKQACMGVAYINERIAALASLLLLSLSLGGCATSTVGSSLMDARAEAPAPSKASIYLPVEDLPPNREKPAMTADEMSKLKKDLSAARDRQTAKARGSAAPAVRPTNQAVRQ